MKELKKVNVNAYKIADKPFKSNKRQIIFQFYAKLSWHSLMVLMDIKIDGARLKITFYLLIYS